jgi:uncharacterized protein (TIGR03118 family)
MSFRFWASTLFAALAAAAPARADAFQVTTLVESPNFVAPPGFTGVGSPLIDPNLINPFGMSLSATGPLWVSNQNPGSVASGGLGVPTATLYQGFVNGSAFSAVPLIVQIPTTPGKPGFQNGPSGQVFNTAGAAFSVLNGSGQTVPAVFIFAGRDGTINGWSPAANINHALPIVGFTPNPAAAYTGLALVPGTTPALLAANINAPSMVRFDGTTTTTFTFGLPTLNNGHTLNAFNVQALSNGKVYATFAANGPGYAGGPASGGALAIIDPTTGAIKQLLVSQAGGILNAPWGLAIAPPGFGPFAGDLLVGNFESSVANGQAGVIDVFDPNSLTFLGTLNNPDGTPIMIPGLWGLQFGNGTAGNGDPTLFAAGGGPRENEGVLVAIDPVPEPGTLGLFLVGGAGLWLARRLRARPA